MVCNSCDAALTVCALSFEVTWCIAAAGRNQHQLPAGRILKRCRGCHQKVRLLAHRHARLYIPCAPCHRCRVVPPARSPPRILWIVLRSLLIEFLWQTLCSIYPFQITRQRCNV